MRMIARTLVLLFVWWWAVSSIAAAAGAAEGAVKCEAVPAGGTAEKEAGDEEGEQLQVPHAAASLRVLRNEEQSVLGADVSASATRVATAAVATGAEKNETVKAPRNPFIDEITTTTTTTTETTSASSSSSSSTRARKHHRDLATTTTIELNFEGLGNLALVGDYYNGGSGPNYGVSFGRSAVAYVDADAGGTGSFAHEPSPSTVLNYYDGVDSTMTVAAGFTGLSFYYASDADVNVTVYEGRNGTGVVLASAVPMPKTGICNGDCGDPSGQFGRWQSFDVSFQGLAKSVRFFGVMPLVLFDDVLLTLTTPIVLDFEGIGDLAMVGSYYNGAGGGPSYGVVFSPNARVMIDADAGGSGSFANEPSSKTALYNSFGASILTYEAGFSYLTFYYASSSDEYVKVYDGPSGTGSLLANVLMPATGTCTGCGDPTGTYGNWSRLSVPISGIAKSAQFYGVTSYFDDVTIIPYALPSTRRPTIVPTTPPTKRPTVAPTRFPTAIPTTRTYVLDFEGVTNTALVGDYYNGAGGGPGRNYGVRFGASAIGLVDTDAGGSGNFANEPSPSTTLYFYSDADSTMTVVAGFTGLSFYYTSDADVNITVYEGQDGTGAVLASAIVIPSTGICNGDCGDPYGLLGKWRTFSVPFQGLAKLVRFSGSVSYGFIDDVTVTVPNVLDFEGIGDSVPVGNYYNGVGGGPSYGVVFSSNARAVIDSDAGGTASTANEPSGNATFKSFGTSTMTYSFGFTYLSFYYASSSDEFILLYNGPSGTGTLLANVSMPATGTCNTCGDPTGTYGTWRRLSAPFTGVARSVRFLGGSTFFDDVTIGPHIATSPTVSPTNIPTAPPTTATPARPPTRRPSRPSKAPTKVPTAPTCTKTTYFLWNPTTNKQVRQLLNNSASCISVPYNIQVRPCSAPKTLPVTIALRNATTNGLLKTNNDSVAPYFLWGDKKTSTGVDVYPNIKPLPRGKYVLISTIDGTVEKITFTKTC